HLAGESGAGDLEVRRPGVPLRPRPIGPAVSHLPGTGGRGVRFHPEEPGPAADLVKLTYIGGPTALIEGGGVRLLVDPTFDPAGSEYRTAAYVLRKTQGPAVVREAIGPIDAVLLSHDHHFDNLDTSGRELLAHVPLVLTTEAGAQRLGPPARGLAPWQSAEVAAPDGRTLRITATPARHGPPQADRGPVVGFVLAFDDEPGQAVYLSGDTVWYDGCSRSRSGSRSPR